MGFWCGVKCAIREIRIESCSSIVEFAQQKYSDSWYISRKELMGTAKDNIINACTKVFSELDKYINVRTSHEEHACDDQ